MQQDRAWHRKSRDQHGRIERDCRVRNAGDDQLQRSGRGDETDGDGHLKSSRPKIFQAIAALRPSAPPDASEIAAGSANRPVSTSPMPAGNANSPGARLSTQLTRKMLPKTRKTCSPTSHVGGIASKTSPIRRERSRIGRPTSTGTTIAKGTSGTGIGLAPGRKAPLIAALHIRAIHSV